MLQVEGIVNSIFDSMTWLLSETESKKHLAIIRVA